MVRSALQILYCGNIEATDGQGKEKNKTTEQEVRWKA